MNLPAGINLEEILHGNGDCETARASEQGRQVVVKTPDATDRFFSELEFDEVPSKKDAKQNFEAEKRREQKAAEASSYFIGGRMETHEGSLFWIRPYLSRSLKEKVLLKEKPDGAELGSICRSIAKALADLSRIDQSGHGNLGLSNVLIASVRSSDLKLVDLKEADSASGVADKRALGLIIYQLVNAEFVENADSLASVPRDQDWRSLGPAASKWQEFCSELLDPHGSYVDAGWEEIAGELKALSVGPRKLPLAAISILCLVGLVGGILFLKFRPDEETVKVDLDIIEEQWLELLDEYFEWGQVYLRSERDFGPVEGRRAFVEKFYDRKMAGKPFDIIAKSTGLGSKLSNPTADVVEAARSVDVLALSEDQQEDILRSLNMLKAIRKAIEEWPVLAELEKSHEAFAAAGFEFGVAETERLLGVVSFTDNSLTLDRLYGLQSSVAELDDLRDLYDRYENVLARLEQQSESQFLRLYADHLRGRLREAPEINPAGYLRGLLANANAIWTLWSEQSPSLAVSLFEENERTFLSGPDFAISDASLEEWQRLLSDYQRVQPQALDNAQADFREQGAIIRRLTEEINRWQEPGSTPAVFDRKYAELHHEFERRVSELPLVAKNEHRIETLAQGYLARLNELSKEVEVRRMEVKPDIAKELRGMARMPPDLTGALQTAWKAYLDREIRDLDEQSFSSDSRGVGEFIRFKSQHEARLSRFRSFQSGQTKRLSSALSEAWLDELPAELRPAVDTLRKSERARVRASWTSDAVPHLLEGKADQAMERLAERSLSRIRDFESDLIEYTQLLVQARMALRNWSEPPGGFPLLWEKLHQSPRRTEWSESQEFAGIFGELQVLVRISGESAGGELSSLLLDSSSSGFARYLALNKIAATQPLSFEEIERFRDPIKLLSDQVPESYGRDFQKLRLNIWMKAFRNEAADWQGREGVMALAEAYGVKSSDLTGDSRVYYELFSALTLLRANQSRYLEAPHLLKELSNTLRSLAEFDNDPELQGLVAEMDAVELKAVENPLENAEFIEKGWSIVQKTDQRLVLKWEAHQVGFLLVDGEDGDFFLSQNECSIALFNDWMTKNRLWDDLIRDFPTDLGFVDDRPLSGQRYDPGYDSRLGMRIWTVSRSGLSRRGIAMRRTWYDWNLFPQRETADEVSDIEARFQQTLGLCPPGDLKETLPMQHLGSRFAQAFADSMGMRLPTPRQWNIVTRNANGERGLFWQSRLESALSTDGNSGLSNAEASALRVGSFYVDSNVPVSGNGAGRSALLAAVDAGEPSNFRHLAGNVAEYLHDPERGDYFVAGGSGLSSVANTWDEVHALPVSLQRIAYSDVGLRLALPGPEESAYDRFLRIIETHWQK